MVTKTKVLYLWWLQEPETRKKKMKRCRETGKLAKFRSVYRRLSLPKAKYHRQELICFILKHKNSKMIKLHVECDHPIDTKGQVGSARLPTLFRTSQKGFKGLINVSILRKKVCTSHAIYCTIEWTFYLRNPKRKYFTMDSSFFFLSHCYG